MGYITDTGVEQFYRDVRVTSIYEGTNGIQAVDLIGRKLNDNGKIAFELLKDISLIEKKAYIFDKKTMDLSILLKKARKKFKKSLKKMLNESSFNDRLAGASPFLKAFGLLLCGSYLLKAALISNNEIKFDIASFYFHQILPEMSSNLKAVDCSFENLNNCDLERL